MCSVVPTTFHIDHVGMGSQFFSSSIPNNQNSPHAFFLPFPVHFLAFVDIKIEILVERLVCLCIKTVIYNNNFFGIKNTLALVSLVPKILWLSISTVLCSKISESSISTCGKLCCGYRIAANLSAALIRIRTFLMIAL